MDNHIVLFARITPRPEFFEDARRAVLSIVPATREEPGCHEFILHEGDGDGRLYLYEKFVDEAAFAAHHAQPYTRDVFEKYETWLAAPVEITRLRLL